MTSFEDRRRELLKDGEGSISHMYLDTVGKVTVGVGNMLPDADAAVALAFVRRETGERATDAEIRADFASVSAQKMGKLASSYKHATKLDLPDDAIDALLDKRIAGFESGLRKDFPDYDDYPESAKLGLMDMAFNLGNSGLVNKFPSFTRAARARDWAKCAKECERKGISKTRNDEVRHLFESTA